MKILFDHSQPFFLAHGGFQVQIEQTKRGLEAAGVSVEFVRWWDPAQNGDVIHFFGRPSATYISLARNKGIKIVLSELLTALGSRSASARIAQKWLTRFAKAALPSHFTHRLAWEAFELADAVVAGTLWEAHLFAEIFGAAREKIVCIENGVESVFFRDKKVIRGRWLVCTATITERKRVIELAEAAVRAQVPVWIIGKPYSVQDSYGQQFLDFAKGHADLIRYEGPIEDRSRLAQVYREARGFVLLSEMESLSLSAGEAAACGCPLLLSDLPWARSAFGADASYCPVSSPDRTSAVLRAFYERAPELPLPPQPKTWPEIGEQLKQLYGAIISECPQRLDGQLGALKPGKNR
jgi:glycosyltransferase involved in cell wall biosynthesis